MTVILENSGTIVLMACLLIASGIFSSSETAFFNISSRKAIQLLASKNKFKKLAGQLIKMPKQLLTTLLLANMAVNVCYFSFASKILVDVSKEASPAIAVCFAVLSFFALLLFGEMFPKSMAFKNSDKICIICALPCYICMRILQPIRYLLDFLVTQPLVRLVGIGKTIDTTISPRQVKALIDATQQTDNVKNNENQILTNIIELNHLRAKHFLQPRVDMAICEISQTSEQALKIMRDGKLRYLPINEKDLDNIVGYVDVKDLISNPKSLIKDNLKKVNFVPELKSAESILEMFQKSSLPFVIAVDEFGGIAGRIDRIDMAELLFRTNQYQNDNLIEQIGPMEYRLSGNLAASQWVSALGLESFQTQYSTIAGLIAALSGKIPSPGDVVNYNNLKFTVEKVEQNRVQTVLLNIITDESNGTDNINS